MDFGRPLLTQQLQQPTQQRVDGNVLYKPWENSLVHASDQEPNSQSHPSPSVIGDLIRPLSLNLAHDENNKMNVKAVQKEAVLSYVKAKTSPSTGVQPPPLRSPTTELLSPTLPYRSTNVTSSPHTELKNSSPPYRPPPTEPPSTLGNRKTPAVNAGPQRLSRQNSLTNTINRTETPPPSNHPPHTAASFTVRRELERQREEMEQVQHLRQVFHLYFVFFLRLSNFCFDALVHRSAT